MIQMTDKEGNTYKTVKIGKQEWMTENLNVSHFRNGDPIPEAKTYEEWKRAGEEANPAWCYYGNDAENGKTYGKMYNWYAVNDSRGIAPEGWHVPTDNEWTNLTNYLGVKDAAGGKLKETGTEHWNSPNKGATNETGFTAYPGGFCYGSGGFGEIGSKGYWWSATESPTSGAYSWIMYYDLNSVYRNDSYKEDGFSVRCMRD